MIVRVIVLIAVILAVLYLVDVYKQLQQGSAARRREVGGRSRRDRAGHLVGCAACGVHVPASRALWSEKQGQRTAFCSPECRRAGLRT